MLYRRDMTTTTAGAIPVDWLVYKDPLELQLDETRIDWCSTSRQFNMDWNALYQDELSDKAHHGSVVNGWGVKIGGDFNSTRNGRHATAGVVPWGRNLQISWIHGLSFWMRVEHVFLIRKAIFYKQKLLWMEIFMNWIIYWGSTFDCKFQASRGSSFGKIPGSIQTESFGPNWPSESSNQFTTNHLAR